MKLQYGYGCYCTLVGRPPEKFRRYTLQFPGGFLWGFFLISFRTADSEGLGDTVLKSLHGIDKQEKVYASG